MWHHDIVGDRLGIAAWPRRLDCAVRCYTDLPRDLSGPVFVGVDPHFGADANIVWPQPSTWMPLDLASTTSSSLDVSVNFRVWQTSAK